MQEDGGCRRQPCHMEKRETAKSHEAIPIRSADAPYGGAAGQTRFEQVHLVAPDGSLSSLSLCRVVNAETHPELQERALAGDLHRLDDGRELALCFVYHDPAARKFALVLPSSLAHTELKEWSLLMAEIAQDTRHPVPLYVRDNTTVIGKIAFERYVTAEPAMEDDGDDAALLDAESAAAAELAAVQSAEVAQREQLLLERERELAEQERALIRMAEALTSREGELLRQQEQLETARVDLELREQELNERGRPAPELHALGTSRTSRTSRTSWTQVGVVSDSVPAGYMEEGLAAGGEKGYAVRSHPPPLPGLRAHARSAGPPPLPLRQRAGAPPLLAARSQSAEVALKNTDALDEPQVHPSAPPPLPHHPPNLSLAPPAKDAEPEVTPPAYFAGQRVGQMAQKLVADELWLFVHIDEERAAVFRRGVDLFLQYVEVESYPVLLLTLVAPTQAHVGQPIRLLLDGHSDNEQRVLEHLSRSFRARVALYIGGVYYETLTVASLREGVAQAISDRLAQLPAAKPAIGAADAMLRVQHAPPALSNDDLPFGPARREASTTATVLASVEQLASWLRPEKLAEATLTYCTPRNVIDATIRRVLRAAVAFGIALPDELLTLALEHRAARDVPSLVRAQLHNFKQRVDRGENDLGGMASRKNWAQLITLAEANSVEVEDSMRALAVAPSNRPSARVDATRPTRPLEGLAPAELRTRLQEPQERLEAIRELCLRGSAGGLDWVLEVLSQLPLEELPQAMASVVSLGEPAGDALINALSAPQPALRQLAGLALGRLKLRRALLPLLKQLELEDSDIQTELARALGDFGAAAVRALAHAVSTSGQPDRFIAALAHVANHGAAREVERLENSAEPPVAYAARKAMARRSRMEWEDLAVREQRTLGEGETAALLSQAFYAALTKVAI